MKYITWKRFRRNGNGGVHFNLPRGTELEKKQDGALYYKGKSVVVARSFASHEHFARNDDGEGIRRGELSSAIVTALGGNTRETTPEWDAVFNDAMCQSYRRKEHEDYWLWDDSFYNAPIKDLEYIAGLVGLRKG